MVTHGGHGTVMRALVNGVPMLVIPHGRDQNDNAVRVTERGAGLRLTAGASVEEIRGACERLLGEAAFLEGAKRLGETVAAEAAGCSVVKELVGAAGAGVGGVWRRAGEGDRGVRCGTCDGGSALCAASLFLLWAVWSVCGSSVAAAVVVSGAVRCAWSQVARTGFRNRWVCWRFR